MTSQTKHTPTPWNLDPMKRCIYRGTNLLASCWLPRAVLEERQPGESWLDMRLRTEPERNAIDAEEAANAAFIVLACNHHDELVSALRLTTDTLANCREAMLDLGVRGKVEEQIGLLVATSRAILAKLTP